MNNSPSVQELLEAAAVRIDPAEQLERDELGDAELFAELLQNAALFDHQEGCWFLWDGVCWRRDRTNRILGMVANNVGARFLQLAAEARLAGDEPVSRRLRRRAEHLCSRQRMLNVLQIAASLPPMALSGDEWDVPPMTLPVANGLLDLSSGTLRPTTPADRIRDRVPVAWAGVDYAAPRWNLLLHGIFGGDQEMIDFVQRLFGYAISGARSEQVLPILWGNGANGKSTLVEALSSVLGQDLCMTTQTDSLMDGGRGDGNAARPYIAMLRHKRLVWASESREGGRLNVGLAKQLTGDDTMTARALYGKPISFRQTHTIMLISNHRPRLPQGGDEAIWRRMLLVPFTQCFVDEPRRPNEHRRERNIAAALQHEGPGILAWLGRGCLEWQRLGLRPPAAVTESTRRYREEEDLIGQYMQDRLVHGERLHVAVGDLYRDYVRWCEETGLPAEGGREFGRAVTARLGPSVIIRNGRRTLRVYPGVSLAPG